MENMRRIINIQAGKPVLAEPKNNIKTLKGSSIRVFIYSKTNKCTDCDCGWVSNDL